MTSGSRSKRQRRAQRTPPPVRSRGPRARRASPKVLIGAAIALVLIGGGIGAAVALTGGSSSTKPLSDAADVRQLLKGIPQHGNVLGAASAPVTMTEYVDLQCPFCQQFETQVMPSVIPQYVRTGKVKVDLRPIAFIGPDSERGRLAAIAAGQQNRLFDFTQLLYANQGPENSGWLSDGMIKRAAASIPGLDASKLLAARSSAKVQAEAQRFDALAQADSVNSTPTIYIGRTGAKPQLVQLSSPTDEPAIVDAITRSLG